MTELNLRALHSPSFEFMVGMRVIPNEHHPDWGSALVSRVYRNPQDTAFLVLCGADKYGDDHRVHVHARDYQPDVQDPGTQGILLGIIRKAWKDPGAYLTIRDNGVWACVVSPNNGEYRQEFQGISEAHALVFALEASRDIKSS